MRADGKNEYPQRKLIHNAEIVIWVKFVAQTVSLVVSLAFRTSAHEHRVMTVSLRLENKTDYSFSYR